MNSDDAPDIERIRPWLDEPAVWQEPSGHLRSDVLAALAREATASTVPSEPGAAPRSKARRGLRGWQSGLLVVAAAAATAIAVVRPWQGDDSPDWTQRLVAGPAGVGLPAALVSGWNEDAGTHLQIDVSGLPLAPDGAFYEIWMTAPDGRHVSAGTFRSGGVIDAWSGVRRGEFPRIWITLEPNDGDAALNGPAVLDTAE